MTPQSNTAHTKAKSDPKASGVTRIINKPPEYIGWRTMAIRSGRNDTLARPPWISILQPPIWPLAIQSDLRLGRFKRKTGAWSDEQEEEGFETQGSRCAYPKLKFSN
jgi:hypothetical protein